MLCQKAESLAGANLLEILLYFTGNRGAAMKITACALLLVVTTLITTQIVSAQRLAKNQRARQPEQTAAAPVPQKAGSMSLKEIVRTARKWIVSIRVGIKAPNPEAGKPDLEGVSTGTGFFVNKEGYVITALHVVSPIGLPPQAQRVWMQALVPMQNYGNERAKLINSFTATEFDIIAEDPKHDLALLKLKANPFAFKVPMIILPGEENPGMHLDAPTFAAMRPEDGEAIATTGYPLDIPAVVTTSGWLASAWGFDIPGSSLPARPGVQTSENVSDLYMANLVVNHGNSGGPVYIVSSGYVIGVCVAFKLAPLEGAPNTPLGYNSGISFIVPSKYVIELLRNNNVTAAIQ